MNIFRAWPEQNYQVKQKECLVPNPLPPHPCFPKELHLPNLSHLCATPGAAPIMPSEHVVIPPSLICAILKPACSYSALHFSTENRRKRRGVEKEVLWEGQPAGVLGVHLRPLSWAMKKWDEMKAFQKELLSPTTSNSISAPKRKIKITFCGMKWWQWLWIQLCYCNLEITLPFEAH